MPQMNDRCFRRRRQLHGHDPGGAADLAKPLGPFAAIIIVDHHLHDIPPRLALDRQADLELGCRLLDPHGLAETLADNRARRVRRPSRSAFSRRYSSGAKVLIL